MATARENLANIDGDIALARTVIQGASVFVQRVPQMIEDAKNATMELGATAEEVQPISDLSDLLEQEANTLLGHMATLPNGTPAPAGPVPTP